jgi:hypothetical protein
VQGLGKHRARPGRVWVRTPAHLQALLEAQTAILMKGFEPEAPVNVEPWTPAAVAAEQPEAVSA